VLSIRNALSIQSHPTKQRAAYLHSAFPEHYKDANHKPELALAVSPTLAMCGFRPLAHLHHFLSAASPAHVPELRRVIGDSLCDAFVGKFVGDGQGESVYVPADVEGSHEQDGLSHYPSLPRVRFNDDDGDAAVRELYSALMTADKSLVEANVDALVQRLGASRGGGSSGHAWASLVLDLHAQYGADIGIFSMFFFNVLSLQCGDAIFLAPCLPHAYIRGELVELMACSDNVVRAGLTPKHKHVDELLSMLLYSSKPPLQHHMKPEVLVAAPHASLKLFAPPPEFPEFCLLQCTVQPQASIDVPLPYASPYILLCLQVPSPPHFFPSPHRRFLTLAQGKATVTIVPPSLVPGGSSSAGRSIEALHALLLAPVAQSVLRVNADQETTLYASNRFLHLLYVTNLHVPRTPQRSRRCFPAFDVADTVQSNWCYSGGVCHGIMN
jgi:mannose-6-phosphate isomerase class I